jgi:hypothetical protein
VAKGDESVLCGPVKVDPHGGNVKQVRDEVKEAVGGMACSFVELSAAVECSLPGHLAFSGSVQSDLRFSFQRRR